MQTIDTKGPMIIMFGLADLQYSGMYETTQCTAVKILFQFHNKPANHT
jgi:hypothetical protein